MNLAASAVPAPGKESTSTQKPVPAPVKEKTVSVEAVESKEEKEESGEKANEDEESIVVNMDTIISELKALYLEQHGTDPSDEIVARWKSEVNDVKESNFTDNNNEKEASK